MASRLITGLTRERERSLQQRLFARVANATEPQIRKSISRAMREMGRHWDDTGRRSEAVQAHREEIEQILDRSWRRMFDAAGTRILEALQKSGRRMERKNEDEFARRMRDWMRTNGARKVTQIAGTTEDQATSIINDAVARASDEGLGQDGIGKLVESAIRDEGGVISRHRARVIARTETHTASQAANNEAAAATGLQLRKEWLAAGGGDTRDDHSDADGQTVAMNDPFDVGGERLMYPGDPSGSAENVINCRCAVGFVPVE